MGSYKVNLSKSIFSQVSAKKASASKRRNTMAKKKVIAPIVKNVIENQLETKQFYQLGDFATYQALNDNVWYTLQIQAGGGESYMPLYNINQGAGNDERIGHKITLVSCLFRSSLIFPHNLLSTAGTGFTELNDYYRVLVIQLKRNGGTTLATIPAYLNTIETNASPFASPNSTIIRTLDFQSRCYVLKDMIIKRDAISSVYTTGTLSVSPRQTHLLTLNIKPRVPNITWLTGTTATANPDESGAIGVFVRYYPTQGTSGDAFVQQYPEVLVNYKDK